MDKVKSNAGHQSPYQSPARRILATGLVNKANSPIEVNRLRNLLKNEANGKATSKTGTLNESENTKKIAVKLKRGETVKLCSSCVEDNKNVEETAPKVVQKQRAKNNPENKKKTKIDKKENVPPPDAQTNDSTIAVEKKARAPRKTKKTDLKIENSELNGSKLPGIKSASKKMEGDNSQPKKRAQKKTTSKAVQNPEITAENQDQISDSKQNPEGSSQDNSKSLQASKKRTRQVKPKNTDDTEAKNEITKKEKAPKAKAPKKEKLIVKVPLPRKTQANQIDAMLQPSTGEISVDDCTSENMKNKAPKIKAAKKEKPATKIPVPKKTKMNQTNESLQNSFGKMNITDLINSLNDTDENPETGHANADSIRDNLLDKRQLEHGEMEETKSNDNKSMNSMNEKDSYIDDDLPESQADMFPEETFVRKQNNDHDDINAINHDLSKTETGTAKSSKRNPVKKTQTKKGQSSKTNELTSDNNASTTRETSTEENAIDEIKHSSWSLNLTPDDAEHMRNTSEVDAILNGARSFLKVTDSVSNDMNRSLGLHTSVSSIGDALSRNSSMHTESVHNSTPELHNLQENVEAARDPSTSNVPAGQLGFLIMKSEAVDDVDNNRDQQKVLNKYISLHVNKDHSYQMALGEEESFVKTKSSKSEDKTKKSVKNINATYIKREESSVEDEKEGTKKTSKKNEEGNRPKASEKSEERKKKKAIEKMSKCSDEKKKSTDERKCSHERKKELRKKVKFAKAVEQMSRYFGNITVGMKDEGNATLESSSTSSSDSSSSTCSCCGFETYSSSADDDVCKCWECLMGKSSDSSSCEDSSSDDDDLDDLTTTESASSSSSSSPPTESSSASEARPEKRACKRLSKRRPCKSQRSEPCRYDLRSRH